MAAETVTVLISNPDTNKALAPVRLNLAGRVSAEIPFNTPTRIDARLIGVLRDSEYEFEIVEGTTPAPADASEDGGGADLQGAGTAVEDPPAEKPLPHVSEKFLDRSVPDIIPDLATASLPRLKAILAAETQGKTRKSLIAELEALIAAKTEG